MSTPELRPNSPVAYLQTGFLERLAHELRGPIGVTSGVLDEIELALGADAEKVRAYLLMARRGTERVLRTVERLQRTAQLEGGALDWAKTPTDLRGLVAEAVKRTELLEARRCVCVTVSSGEEACRVSVDSEWMRTAVAEVVSNAIRFARARVLIHTEASAGHVQVVVADDGPGFAGPIAHRFEPPSDARGVGLSLPLVSDVVAAHGGRIELGGSRTSEGSQPTGAHVALILPRLMARGT
jgi:two-component system, OmpR family, sensor histidine kinase TctE